MIIFPRQNHPVVPLSGYLAVENFAKTDKSFAQKNFSTQAISPSAKTIQIRKTAQTKKLSSRQNAFINLPARNHPLQAAKENTQPTSLDDILLQLHRRIAAKQRYPLSALQNHESGTVKVGFLLLPNGELQKITMLVSSGFVSIDKAAITAVSEVGRIPNLHLTKPTYFTVDIVFNG